MAPRVGMVLSGGGSRGAFQAGAYQALWDHGVRPDYVVGTSIGALNGANIAAGIAPDDLRHLWLRPDGRILRYRRDIWRIWRWRGYLDPRPLRRFIEKQLDLEALRASPVAFQLTTVDLQTGQIVAWDKEDLTLDHFIATTALPPAFAPVSIQGRDHVDGGVRNNMPLWPAVAAGCDTVYGLLHDPLESHPVRRPRTIREMVWRISDINWHARAENDMAFLAAREGPARGLSRRFRFIPIVPDPALGTDMLRFDAKDAARLYALGHEAGRKALQQDSDRKVPISLQR